MLDVVRGEIYDVERATQQRDFSGLRYGSITPSDIDGMIEWKDKCYVIYEAKLSTVLMLPHGQQVMLEKICDDLQKVKPTIVIWFKHDTEPNEPIPFAACKVHRYRFQGEWLPPRKEGETVKELTDWFLTTYGDYDSKRGFEKCPTSKEEENTVFLWETQQDQFPDFPSEWTWSSSQEADGIF